MCGFGTGEAVSRGNDWASGKRLAGIVTACIAAALLRPLAEHRRATPRDSFPLSHYPMFSLKRSQRARVTYLVGIDDAGGRHLLPYRCAGAGGLNQVRRQINRAVREGRANALCDAVAASAPLQTPDAAARIVEVQIVTGAYRLDDYFSGTRRTPEMETVLASRPTRKAGA